jgi:hypothetical protein
MKFERNIEGKPADAGIRAALERVVASSGLGKSPKLVSFLRFVVEAELSGQSRQTKPYTIATDTLGRDARFDPQADPIVRVEAGRLRRTLEHYYATEGRGDPIVIELPSGGYVPLFRSNIAPHGAVARMRDWRRQFAGTLRDNYRLVILIAVISATVSLSFDVMWMTLGKLFGPAAETAQQIVHPAQSAHGPSEFRQQ